MVETALGGPRGGGSILKSGRVLGARPPHPSLTPFRWCSLHAFGRFPPILNIRVLYFVVERLRLFGTFSHFFFAAVLTAICVFAYSHSVSFRAIPLVRLWYAGVQACVEPAWVL